MATLLLSAIAEKLQESPWPRTDADSNSRPLVHHRGIAENTLFSAAASCRMALPRAGRRYSGRGLGVYFASRATFLSFRPCGVLWPCEVGQALAIIDLVLFWP